mgnify:CR=1 FL=1
MIGTGILGAYQLGGTPKSIPSLGNIQPAVAQIVARAQNGPIIEGALLKVFNRDSSGADDGYANIFREDRTFVDQAGSYRAVELLNSDASGVIRFLALGGIYNIQIEYNGVVSRWEGYRIGTAQARDYGTLADQLPIASDLHKAVEKTPDVSGYPTEVLARTGGGYGKLPFYDLLNSFGEAVKSSSPPPSGVGQWVRSGNFGDIVFSNTGLTDLNDEAKPFFYNDAVYYFADNDDLKNATDGFNLQDINAAFSGFDHQGKSVFGKKYVFPFDFFYDSYAKYELANFQSVSSLNYFSMESPISSAENFSNIAIRGESVFYGPRKPIGINDLDFSEQRSVIDPAYFIRETSQNKSRFVRHYLGEVTGREGHVSGPWTRVDNGSQLTAEPRFFEQIDENRIVVIVGMQGNADRAVGIIDIYADTYQEIFASPDIASIHTDNGPFTYNASKVFIAVDESPAKIKRVDLGAIDLITDVITMPLGDYIVAGASRDIIFVGYIENEISLTMMGIDVRDYRVIGTSEITFPHARDNQSTNVYAYIQKDQGLLIIYSDQFYNTSFSDGRSILHVVKTGDWLFNFTSGEWFGVRAD